MWKKFNRLKILIISISRVFILMYRYKLFHRSSSVNKILYCPHNPVLASSKATLEGINDKCRGYF